MTALRFAALLLLLSPLTGCDLVGDGDPPAPTPITLSPLAKNLVAQGNDFGIDLYAEVAAEDDGNLMLSPLSASAALTMLLNGADGETASQIHAMLGLAPEADLAEVNAAYRSLRDQLLDADPEVQFTLANAVFQNTLQTDGAPLKPTFLSSMRDGFDARVDALDFSAPEALGTINGWASDNTNGRVPEVMNELDTDLVVLLMNALYFKGDWSTPFEVDNTSDGDFTLADGSTVRVPTMTGRPSALPIAGDGYTGVELPYGRKNFSMVLLKPDAGPLADFAADLRAGLWRDATTRLDAQDAWSAVDVRLPRFTFSYEKLLNANLQALGMVDAFTTGADLSRMSDDPRLMVSFVKQNTFLQVNEEGTEAAAVTTVGAVATSLGPHFYADRPFVLAIRERTTNTPLFIGQVAHPP